MHARERLTYRPIVPGSDEHLDLIMRTSNPHRSILYPSLHRRACLEIAAAAARVATKQEPAGSGIPTGPTTLDPTRLDQDGCSAECA